jgi:hypothetical protein
MMMRMLEAGGIPVLSDHIRQPDENNPYGYYEFEPVKQVKTETGWLEEARGKVVKMVYLLLYDLPESYQYRVIVMRRDLEEVIASQAMMLRRKGHEKSLLTDEALLGLYRTHLARLEAWLVSRPNFEVIYIDYHRTLTAPEEIAEVLDRFLGGGMDMHKMIGAVDTSLRHWHRSSAEGPNSCYD